MLHVQGENLKKLKDRRQGRVCVERTKKSSVRPHGESILGRISLKGSRTNTWSESC